MAGVAGPRRDSDAPFPSPLFAASAMLTCDKRDEGRLMYKRRVNTDDGVCVCPLHAMLTRANKYRSAANASRRET